MKVTTVLFGLLGVAGVIALALVLGGAGPQSQPQHELRFVEQKQRAHDPRGAALGERIMKGYALVRQGEAALAENDLRGAEAVFREVLSLDRTNAEGWAGLAETLDKQGETSEAIAAYRILTNPGPKWGSTLASDPSVLMRYAVLLTRTNQWTEAVQVYEKAAGRLNDGQGAALPSLPTNFSPQMRRPADLMAMAHVGLGMALAKRDKNDDALAAFAQAAKLRPNSPVAQFYHGYGLKAAGRTAEAKSAFARAAANGRGALKASAEKELR